MAGKQSQPMSKGGATRDVYDLGNAVAKVAKNAKGLQQNDEELDDTPNTPKALAKGKDFVITEKVMRDDTALGEWLKPLQDYSESDFEEKKPELVEQMKEMGLDNFLKFPLLWNDFISKRNWGLNSEGHPVLLDKGSLNSHIYDHDEAPKKVQGEYDKIKQSRRIVKKSYAYKGG